MLEHDYNHQMRYIRDPNNPAATIVPTWPLFIILSDGTAGEAFTIRGATAIVAGEEYQDCEDGEIEWHVRLETARREAMKALARGINAVVFDSRLGVIPNNYAARLDDQDYRYDEDENNENVYKIRIENDRLFLLSLLEIRAITILERSDSYFLRDHPLWRAIRNGGEQCCKKCLHKQKNNKGKDACPVYDRYVDDRDGWDCCGFNILHQEHNPTETEYINLIEQYDVKQLMETIGQGWMFRKK